MIGIYIPTLGRSAVISALVDNIRQTSVLPYRIVFVTEEHDEQSTVAALKTNSAVITGNYGTYSNAIQAAFESDDSVLFMYANDDFHWTPGWDVNAFARMWPGVSVVGFNDGSSQCVGSTFQLVRRQYVIDHGVIDMPGRVLFPYSHNFVDTEFYETAVHRGVFAYAPDAIVIHNHPDFGLAALDDTYRKTRARFSDDAVLFGSRRHLWGR